MNRKRVLGLGRVQRLTTEAFWIGFGQALAILAALIGIRVLTELLTPTAYGELALGMTIATLVSQTVLGPLGNGVARFYAPAVERNDVAGYLRAVVRMALWGAGLVFGLALIAFVGLQIAGRDDWIAIMLTAALLAILSDCNSILNSIQNAARNRAIVALHQGIESWFRILVAAGLILWLGATSSITMVGYAIAVMLVLVSQYVFFRKTIYREGAPVAGENWSQRMWTFSWPFASWGIFTWAQTASDRWALNFFGTTHEVGLYAVLFQLGYYPISLLTGMSLQFLTPIFYQRAGAANDSGRNIAVDSLNAILTGMVLCLTGIVSLLMYMFHARIFALFASKDYGTVSYLLPWMTLASGVFAAGQTRALSLMSQMQTRKIALPKITIAVLGLTLNFAAAYVEGITGIVIALVIVSSLYSLWIMALAAKHRPASSD